MAENEQGAQAGGAQAPKKSKKLFIIIGAVVVVAGIVAALFLTGVIGGHSEEKEKEHKEDAVKVPEAPKPALELKEFVVNLADTDKARYLKAIIVLEVANEEVKKACEASLAPIRNSILELLSSKTFAQVRDIKGKTRLRQEIIVRLNEILGTNGISQVYLTDFIIQ